MELLSAVEHMADCGFAHMDIKPANLLVAAARGGLEGEIQILLGDFGTVIPSSAAMETAAAGAPVRRWCVRAGCLPTTGVSPFPATVVRWCGLPRRWTLAGRTSGPTSGRPGARC